MSFLVWGAAATAIGAGVKAVGAGVKGYKASKAGGDTLGQAENAEQIRQDEIDLSNDTSNLNLKKNKTSFELAMESITNQAGDVSSQGTGGLLSATREKEGVISKGGFAKSGQSDAIFSESTSKVRSSVDRSMNELELKSKGASSDYINTIEGINISKEKDLAAINQRFTQRLGEIGQTADTFMEGIFGSDNKIKGYDYGNVT